MATPGGQFLTTYFEPRCHLCDKLQEVTRRREAETANLPRWFLAQLSRCAYTITFRKTYIPNLEIWTIRLWTVG